MVGRLTPSPLSRQIHMTDCIIWDEPQEKKTEPNVEMLSKLEEEEWNKKSELTKYISGMMNSIVSLAVGSMVLSEFSKTLKEFDKPKQKKEKQLWPPIKKLKY